MTDLKGHRYFSWIYRHALHLGPAAVLLAAASSQLLGLPALPMKFFIVMWLATQTFYSVSACLPSKGILKYVGSQRNFSMCSIVVLALTGIIVLLIFNYKRYIFRCMVSEGVLFWPFLLLIGSYYPIRMHITRLYPRLALFKPIVIGVAWAWWVIVVPVLFLQSVGPHLSLNSEKVGHLFLYVSLLLSGVSVISDFRDVDADRSAAFPTWATLADSAFAKRAIAVCFLILGMWICAFYMSGVWPQFRNICLLLTPFLVASICTMALQKKRNPIFFVWAVDGILFLTSLCFYLIRVVE